MRKKTPCRFCSKLTKHSSGFCSTICAAAGGTSEEQQRYLKAAATLEQFVASNKQLGLSVQQTITCAKESTALVVELAAACQQLEQRIQDVEDRLDYAHVPR